MRTHEVGQVMIVLNPHSKALSRRARHKAQRYKRAVDRLNHEAHNMLEVYGESEEQPALGKHGGEEQSWRHLR